MNADNQINEGLLGANLFAYCENNPVNYSDPDGNECLCLHQRVYNHVCYTREGEYPTVSSSQSNSSSTDSSGGNSNPVHDFNSSAYKSDNLFYKIGLEGQCTWYAYGRTLEVTGKRMPTCQAGAWHLKTELSTGNIIRSNCVAVFSGHVVYIESWDPATQTVTFSEANWPRDDKLSSDDGVIKTASLTRFEKRQKFVCYIYTD